MRILICGDVVGSSGRKAVAEHVPRLRRDLDLDFVIVNGENAAHGFGITGPLCAELYAAGADVITTGNHVWDQREIANYIENDPRLLRPLNYSSGTPGRAGESPRALNVAPLPGRGAGVFPARDGRQVMVIHPMGRLYMEPLDNPFAAVETALANHRLGASVAAIVVDMHAEATSEKMAMGVFLDGRVSAVVGSHTHVPTADARILPGGTAYLTDLGMCGDYDSVIGMEKGLATERFVRKVIGGRLEPAEGPGTLSGLYLETDDATGLARRVDALDLHRLGHVDVPDPRV
ncbi:MAG: TIGR00282 family metallophosphoesterase, partial [Pseudomonadota bacterium]